MESLAALETAAKAKEALGLLNTARLAIAKRRYPRPRSKSKGILIAISTENELNRQKVNNDFLKTLREIVGVQEMDKRFEIVELPWYHLEKVKTIDDAKSVIEKCNCKFMLWGVVKEREIDKKPYIVFDVRSLAFHGEIVQELSDVLSQEMALLLPQRVLVSKDNDLLEIEFNAVNTALACRYIIAETAYLSGEEDFSLDLFERLAEEVGKMNLAPLPERLRSHVQLLQKKI